MGLAELEVCITPAPALVAMVGLAVVLVKLVVMVESLAVVQAVAIMVMRGNR